ncbi:MAG: hypothetical protein LV480_04790 [Methylacidiphilales bacterium]|nr:hypothetical protein [Candidatus Methylacidiphilales bacterium]
MKLSTSNIFRFAALIFLNVGHSFAEDVKIWSSPNHMYQAVAKTIFGPQDTYTNYQVVKIFGQKESLLASLSLDEGSGINRAMILYAKWSGDSRFFVFMTESSGGHSIWHEPTYVYDATTSYIYSIDDTLGATTSSNRALTITLSDAIQLDFYNFQFEKDSDPLVHENGFTS